VVVDLGDGVSVAGSSRSTLTIGFENSGVGVWRFFFHPRQKRRAEVETYGCVVVNDLLNATVAAKNASGGIGLVTLSGDTLVPIVIRLGRILKLNGFEILDENVSIADTGATNGSTFLVTYRRRRPVR